MPKENSSSAAYEEKNWYCPKYQSNKCTHKSSHVINVKGEYRFAKHVCATGWLSDKKNLSIPSVPPPVLINGIDLVRQ